MRSSSARLVAGAAWASAPRFCGLKISWIQGLAHAPSLSPIEENGVRRAISRVHGAKIRRECRTRGTPQANARNRVSGIAGSYGGATKSLTRRVRMPEPNTEDRNGYRSLSPRKFRPQNRGAVAQAAPATSRAQDDLGLLRFHNGFWLQSDWSATDARRVDDRKLTRLRARRGKTKP